MVFSWTAYNYLKWHTFLILTNCKSDFNYILHFEIHTRYKNMKQTWFHLLGKTIMKFKIEYHKIVMIAFVNCHAWNFIVELYLTVNQHKRINYYYFQSKSNIFHPNTKHLFFSILQPEIPITNNLPRHHFTILLRTEEREK